MCCCVDTAQNDVGGKDFLDWLLIGDRVWWWKVIDTHKGKKSGEALTCSRYGSSWCGFGEAAFNWLLLGLAYAGGREGRQLV